MHCAYYVLPYPVQNQQIEFHRTFNMIQMSHLLFGCCMLLKNKILQNFSGEVKRIKTLSREKKNDILDG